MLEILAYSLTGVLLGSFTGLIPGIHPNTVIFSSIPFYLVSEVEFILYAALISGMSVSHTFHDFIPAFYLQAPEGGTALSMSVGSEMASKGRGTEAFHSTLSGGVFSLITFLVFLPILYLFLDDFYSLVTPLMAPLLMFFLFFLIFRSGEKEAFVVAALSGALGLTALNSSISGSFVLMPIFSGLFAIPAIFSSLYSESEIPEQDDYRGFDGRRGGIVGLLAGMMAGVFPGLGAAGSTSFLMPLLDDKTDFLAGMGGVNTSDVVMSMVSLLVIEKARSGTSIALRSLSSGLEHQIFLLIGVCVFCSGFAALTALRMEKVFLKVFEFVSFRWAGLSVLVFLFVVSFWFSGFYGVLVLLTASFIGFYSFLVDCRSVCMAVLLVPVIVFFI